MKRKNYFVPLLIILAISICLITLNIKGVIYPINLPEKLIISLLAPIQTKVLHGIKKIRNGWEHYFYLINIKEENERLKKELNKLISDNSRFLEIEKSYGQLLKLLEFKRSLNFKTIPAEVIGRDINGWFRIIYINKGSNQGIVKGMAVIAPNGLVGQIILAAPNSSKVLLLTDIRNSAAAIVQRSRNSGIVTGSATNGCKMKYLNRNADAKVGDRIVSSGLGGIFPRGLLIGWVKRISEQDSSFFLDAEITPGVDMDKLEEVLVIIDK